MNGVTRLRLEGSVRHLQGLYTIVAGLALSDAIATFVTNSERGWKNPTSIALLIAFVVTLVPFFHGALRLFDDAYIVGEGALPTGRYSLAVDFAFLFAQSGLLFGMAQQVFRVDPFAAIFAILLLVDIVWVVAISGASPEGRSFGRELLTIVTRPRKSVIAQQHWAANNLRHLIVLGLAWGGTQWLLPDERMLQAFCILGFALARTAFDYRGSWEFYFPG